MEKRDYYEVLGVSKTASDDEIKSKFNNGVESIVYDDSLGSIKRLEEFIQEASDRDIPVGFYYSQCCTNPNRASAEAGYVYGVTQKIKSDMGSDFDKVYQLPYMEDVGPVSSEIDYNEDRTTATILAEKVDKCK